MLLKAVTHSVQTICSGFRRLRFVQRRFPTRQRAALRAVQPVLGRRLVADNMRRLRQIRGFSQETLAELTGLNRGYLSSVENARRNVSIDNICKIAAALGVAPRDLLSPAS